MQLQASTLLLIVSWTGKTFATLEPASAASQSQHRTTAPAPVRHGPTTRSDPSCGIFGCLRKQRTASEASFARRKSASTKQRFFGFLNSSYKRVSGQLSDNSLIKVGRPQSTTPDQPRSAGKKGAKARNKDQEHSPAQKRRSTTPDRRNPSGEDSPETRDDDQDSSSGSHRAVHLDRNSLNLQLDTLTGRHSSMSDQPTLQSFHDSSAWKYYQNAHESQKTSRDFGETFNPLRTEPSPRGSDQGISLHRYSADDQKETPRFMGHSFFNGRSARQGLRQWPGQSQAESFSDQSSTDPLSDQSVNTAPEAETTTPYMSRPVQRPLQSVRERSGEVAGSFISAGHSTRGSNSFRARRRFSLDLLGKPSSDRGALKMSRSHSTQ